MAETDDKSTTTTTTTSTKPPSRPTLSLPPRTSGENIFRGGAGASPGPMTLVSSFFSESDPDSEYRSFSQLLAGAISPVSGVGKKLENSEDLNSGGDEKFGGDEKEFRFPQSRPMSLAVSQQNMFTIPPGLSPTSLFDSPRFFSPGQGFGMSHQQALAQVTAQAAQSQSSLQLSNEYPSSMLAPQTTSLDHQPSYGNIPLQMIEPGSSMVESSVVSYSEPRSQPPLNVDKPVDDGYNWRKYGQKQVKGSEFPRSYYKCTHQNCPVKKKVERSLDGHVTEIIYKGQHNHQPPQNVKRSKDGGNSNGRPHVPAYPEMGRQDQGGHVGRSNETATVVYKSRRDQEVSQGTPEQLSGSSDGEEVGNAEVGVEEEDEHQPDPKRRSIEVRASEPASSNRTVAESRIIVQTTSEVDLLDDGYRWRKYGQKVVKGNPHPRSYYKCTSTGCNVRKHVERASTDIKAVITTYEGKHNHDVPAAKHSSHSTGINIRPHNPIPERINQQNQPVSILRFKEEQVT